MENIKIKHIDYTLRQYFNLKHKDTVNYNLDFMVLPEMEKQDHFKTGGYKKSTFGFIKLLQFKLGRNSFSWNDFINAIEEEKGIHKDLILNTSVYKCRQQINYIIEQIRIVNGKEMSALSGYVDIDEQEAGLDRFVKYGNFIQIDKLAGLLRMTYDEIEKQPYIVMFNKLSLEADRSEFNRKLANIRQRNVDRKK